MYSVMSLPSTPVMAVVVVVAPVISGAACANTSKIAPMPSSLIVAKASRSSSGASTVSGIGGILPSSPNSASALTIRGSERGSVARVDSGSA
jgi:hypothetical protein